MNLRRAGLRLGISAAALTGLVVVTSTPASAQKLTDIETGSGKCPANWVCLWSEGEFIRGEPRGGLDYGAVGSDESVSDLGKLKFESQLFRWKGMQDQASSVANKTDNAVCFYEHNGFVGREFRVRAYTQWPNVPSWINDQISSFKFC